MTLALLPATHSALDKRNNILWLVKYLSQLSNHHVHTVKMYVAGSYVMILTFIKNSLFQRDAFLQIICFVLYFTN